jgi:hypothetical protein
VYSFILTEFSRVLDATCAKLISLSLIIATDGLAFKYSGLSIESLLFLRNVCARRGELLRLGDDFLRGGELRLFGDEERRGRDLLGDLGELGDFFLNSFFKNGVIPFVRFGDERILESFILKILGDPCGVILFIDSSAAKIGES